MMSENKVGTYRFVAEPFHCDFSGKLTMSVLGNHLLNCAGFHAADRGFGIATLNENHYTWVLSRLAVELENMPCQYEGFSIQTWVENVYRLFTDRNFAILDKEGKAVGYARSVWAMISMETRKPADLLTLHGGSITDYVCDKECPISKPGRIKVTEKTPVSEYQTRYSDIDINGHVNSIKYIEHILDLFPIEFFKEKYEEKLYVSFSRVGLYFIYAFWATNLFIYGIECFFSVVTHSFCAAVYSDKGFLAMDFCPSVAFVFPKHSVFNDRFISLGCFKDLSTRRAFFNGLSRMVVVSFISITDRLDGFYWHGSGIQIIFNYSTQ